MIKLSILDYSASIFSRQDASLGRGSTQTLGTIPRNRSQSRETIRRNDTDDDEVEDDNSRNSPSRSSLNQFIFSGKDGERLKK